mgnify:CR=1 FL=1
MAEQGHNSGSSVEDEYLLGQVKKIAAIEDEIAGQRHDINETLNEMKAAGYRKELVRQLVKDFQANPGDVQEREEVRRRYLEAIGIAV